MSTDAVTNPALTEPWLWVTPATLHDDQIGRWDATQAGDHLKFLRGERLEETTESHVIRYRSQVSLEGFDVLALDASIPVVNERAAEVIRQAGGEDVQFITAKVVAGEGQVGPYWLVNATRTVRCIDFERSIYTRMPGAPDAVMGFKSLRLHGDRMGDARVARDVDYRSLLYVSPGFAAVVRQAGLRGLTFLSASDAYDHWVLD